MNQKKLYKSTVIEKRAWLQHDIDEAHRTCIYAQIFYDLSRGKETLNSLKVKADNKLRHHCTKFQIMYCDCVHKLSLVNPQAYILSPKLQLKQLKDAIELLQKAKNDMKQYNKEIREKGW